MAKSIIRKLVKDVSQGDWEADDSGFVMTPKSLVFSTHLSPGAKLAWILIYEHFRFVSGNPRLKRITGLPQSFSSKFRAHWLEDWLGCHRHTRTKIWQELIDAGLISDTDEITTIHNPEIALDELEMGALQMTKSRKKQEMLYKADKESVEKVSQIYKEEEELPLSRRSNEQRAKFATEMWNKYRPPGYPSITMMSDIQLKVIENHMSNNRLGPKHEYEAFFMLLRKGIDQNSFWTTQCTRKKLWAITGSSPKIDPKKASNVSDLLELGGLSDHEPQLVEEQKKKSKILKKLAQTIEDYRQLEQYVHQNEMLNKPVHEILKEEIRETEELIRAEGVNPAIFRVNPIVDKMWPTDCLTLTREEVDEAIAALE